MARSLKVAPHQIEQVKLAYQRSGFPSQQALATELGKSADTIRKFFKGEAIDRLNFIEICERLALEWEKIVHSGQAEQPETNNQNRVIQPDHNFVGRDEAIADLDALVNRGERAIVIQARGGVGKTTLARKYLQHRFGSFLEFPIAKETKDIASIEGLLEEKLRQLGEEPGREFMVSLDRLKRKLQAERIGILIDNLEPALDSAGKFIEPHRRYVELLRVLTDPLVQSTTLITSREHLHEPAISMQHYSLKSLDVEAWEQFFQSRNLSTDISVLVALHNAYGGNAKAMDIISGAILEDFSGNVEAYWQANKDDLLIERDLEDLVKNQFNRLQQLDSDAYKLLCRMGCYRYQDVQTVPIEGLVCLLWDVPENYHRRVIKSLRDRSLVDCEDGEFWLHPVIRAEAIARLRISEVWKTTNQQAARFWTESTEIIRTIEDAKRALEAYYQYLEIQDFNQASDVIIKNFKNHWSDWKTRGEPLGRSLYKLGFLQELSSAIVPLLNKVEPGYPLARLYNILGDVYWLTGHIHRSIDCHEESRSLSTELLETFLKEDEESKTGLERLKIVSFFNIGLCMMDLWEIEKAVELFKVVISLAQKTQSSHKHSIRSFFYLALLYSHLGFNQEAYYLVQANYNELSKPIWGVWSKGFSLLSIGSTYKNLGEADRAFEMYHKVISCVGESQYSSIRAKALYGLAELWRQQQDFTVALSYHLEAKTLLEKIGAKCDLAEAYYQLGLTYQAVEESEKSNESFQEAIRLFSGMQAPKQVERVRQSMKN